eukprot:gb/GEZN01013123.1/.p1 GENE.gb/GEZN01013123.1/~~gb/GEZN01013123.1/.p1  ORF type:complete len:302 (-),score=40.23 gb/GEZN01013123.1/:59-964(-)
MEGVQCVLKFEMGNDKALNTEFMKIKERTIFWNSEPQVDFQVRTELLNQGGKGSKTDTSTQAPLARNHCPSCRKAILQGEEKRVMVGGEQVGGRKTPTRERSWHRRCWVCSSCNKPLSHAQGQYHVSNQNELLCDPCHASQAEDASKASRNPAGLGPGELYKITFSELPNDRFIVSSTGVTRLGEGADQFLACIKSVPPLRSVVTYKGLSFSMGDFNIRLSSAAPSIRTPFVIQVGYKPCIAAFQGQALLKEMFETLLQPNAEALAIIEAMPQINPDYVAMKLPEVYTPHHTALQFAKIFK